MSGELMCRCKFSHVSGFFVDYAKVAYSSPSLKVTTQPSLGLLNRTYDSDAEQDDDSTQWQRFVRYVDFLNKQSLNGESYKLVYIIRHGLGVHNIFMETISSEAWNNHWSHLEGDGEVRFTDAKLVEQGIEQAKALGQFWLQETKSKGVQLPNTLYTSPLARCLETTKHVYSEVMPAQHRSFQPTVKELLRERLTDHTCDSRSTKSWIQQNYPGYILEQTFSEQDTLWHADRYESNDEHVSRTQRVLEDIFSNDDSAFISLSTHSYTISTILEVIGTSGFRVAEGTMIPLFIKCERVG
ncbi:hypothetical protein ACHAQJ_000794 [Trichoderma viride]